MKPLTPRQYKIVPGRHYGTPKELWAIRSKPVRGKAGAAAREFLRANAELLGLAGVMGRLRLERTIESVAAQHLIFQQRHRGFRIHRAYITVHIGRDRRIYLAKNRAVPRDLLGDEPAFRVHTGAARRRALRSLRAQARDCRVFPVERMWFPLKEKLRPAFRVRVHRESPREEWIIYVDGRTGDILSKYDNLASARGQAQVFDPNPVVALGDWRPLLRDGRVRRPPADAYSTVALDDLDGTGHLDGKRVSTRFTKGRTNKPDERFIFTNTQAGFEEAMVYFHVDRAIRYLESLGYRGPRAIFSAPLGADVRGTTEDNSWYSPGLGRLTFGTGGVDDGEDGETILHEFGHALQDAICPDFGQSQEAAAMGEGFGDYFAASFFADRKKGAYQAAISSWDCINISDLMPPCLRRLDGPATYESFDHSEGADEHENGQIWSATVWDIWRKLGRDVADRIIIESHFQLDGFTSFAKGARAIIDADRNLFRGRHAAALRRIFRARGIGPVE
jgi:Fungalysin metallopeptidase (M36)